ncbi:MAG: hypothetical protein WKI04_13715 [Ferruginibacter sp.]
MKNFINCLVFTSLFLGNHAMAQNMAINTDGSTPDASAMLDITSTTKGLLAPRLTTTQQNAISLPAKGLLIFNITDNIFRVNTGTPGVPLWTALSPATNAWLLTGNAGSNASTNFLGTTDNVALAFRTNNAQRMVIDGLGRVGVGITNPGNPLVVKDTFEIRRTGSALSQLLFTNTSGTGDFRIGGDGGDIFWQGGGGRNLQMGAYWGITLGGDRQSSAFPAFEPGVLNTGVLVRSQRNVSVPLAIQGFSGTQSANLTEWRNSSGTILNIVNNLGNVAIGTSVFNAANIEKLLVDAGVTTSVNAIVGKGNINSYLQLNIHNNSTGTSASSDVVATANNGDESTNYVDMGINGGNYSGGVMGSANDSYLYNMGNNLLVGTGSATKSLIFMTGGTSEFSNERMRIDGSGNVGIGITNPTYKLQVSAASNPLYLSGLQNGTISDEVLTISGGVVRKITAASLSSGAAGWGLLGNAATNPGTNFIGTTDAQALVTKVNNTQVTRFETNSMALGISANTYNSTHSYVLGSGANVGYNRTAAMALGNNATISADSSLAIGTGAVTNGKNSFAIGSGANSNSTNSLALGRNAFTAYSIADGVAIGTNATANASNSIAIGGNTTAADKTITNAASAIALGNGAVSNSTNAIAIGTGATTGYNNTNPISIGVGAAVSGNNGLALGNGANINYVSNATVLGAGATAGNLANNSTAIGYNTDVTKANEIILGDMTNTALSVGIGSENFSTVNREKLLVDAGVTTSVNSIVGKGNINSYLQLNIQNNSTGTNASSDVVATANNGDESTNYVDMGINGGNYNGGVMGAANDGYLYAMGNNFLIGTANTAKSLIFMTGGTSQVSNERMRIDGTGNVGIGTINPTQKLDIAGNLRVSGAFMPNNLAGVPGYLLQSNGAGVAPSWIDAGSYLTGTTWMQGGNNVSSLKTIGTTSNYDLPFITNNTERMRLSATGELAIGSSAFNAANPEQLLVDAGVTSSVNAIAGKGSIDSYLQLNIQNTSAGTSASSDVVATANNGDESNNYVDMGINNGNYTGGVMGSANDSYLYNMGNNFLVGTGSATKSLIFLTGGTSQFSNERMRIHGNGNVSVGTTSANSTLTIAGSQSVSYKTITGSYTILATDHVIINTGAATPTWTLPAANTCAGRIYKLVNHGSTNITLTPAITIGNASTTTSLSSTSGSNTFQVISDGSVWRKIN